MERLNILYVDSDSVWRGGQEQLFQLMTGMKGRGNRVALASPPDSPLTRRAKEEAIQTYAFRQQNELSPLALLQMTRILTQIQPQVVHFNTPRSILSGGLASRICGVPVRVSSRRVNFPLKSRLSLLKYNWAQDAILTVSLSIRRTLIECGVANHLIAVIYEGVDLDWIDRQHAPSFSQNRNGLVVGTVAHLSSEKGHTILLEAAAQLVPKFPEVTYVIAGGGELEATLKRKARALGIERRVVFTGFRSDTEGLMKQFDVFCLPSLSEGLSSAILAAMASHLPVVATNVGGIPELVVDGETGFLVPPYESKPLFHSLSKLIASRKLRQRMGDKGRKRVEKHLTLGRKLDQTEQLYLRLLRRRVIK